MNSNNTTDEPLRHYSYWRVFFLIVAGLSFVLAIGLPVTGYNLVNKVNQIIFKQIIDDNKAIADFFVVYLQESRKQFASEDEWLHHVREFVNITNMPNSGYVCVIDEHSNFQAYPGFTNEMAAQFSVVPYNEQQNRFQYEMPIKVSEFFDTIQQNDVSGELLNQEPNEDQLIQMQKFYIENTPWAVGVHQYKMTVLEPLQNMMPYIVGSGIGLFLAIVIPFGIFTGYLIRKHELVRNEHVHQIERINIQLQDTNNRLSEMQTDKSRLYARLSHDLRAPLSSIISACSLVRDRVYGEVTEKQTTAMTRVERNTGVLLQLIDSILELSRIESGKVNIHIAPLSLSEVIQELIDNLSPSAESKGISLQACVSEPISTVETDKEKLYLILQNLVNNAVKFTEKGKVTVSAKQQNHDQIEIKVTDTGMGIPVSDQSAIFKEFARGNNGSEDSGVGLGLAITKELIELLGGTIHLSSQIDKGSEFTISFPNKKETAEAAVS